jgi:hypothetical protein
VSAHNAFWPRLETLKFGTTTGLRNPAAVSVYVSEIISYEFSIPQSLFRATTFPLKQTTFVDDTHDVAAFPEAISTLIRVCGSLRTEHFQRKRGGLTGVRVRVCCWSMADCYVGSTYGTTKV